MTERATLLLMKGHPGSGKSTLSRRLAKLLSWTIADKDDARDALTCLTSCSHSELNLLSYDIMFRVAASQLACGNSVIVDCPLARMSLYERALQLATQYEAAVAVVECQADQTVWRSRLEERGAAATGQDSAHKPASWASLQQLLAGYAGADAWSTNGTVAIQHHIILNTSVGSPDHLAAHVVETLQSLRLC